MFKRIRTRLLALSLCSALMSVMAFASPIDTMHFNVVVPNTLTNFADVSVEVTAKDFIAAMPYVVDLDVDAPVPIAVIVIKRMYVI